MARRVVAALLVLVSLALAVPVARVAWAAWLGTNGDIDGALQVHRSDGRALRARAARALQQGEVAAAERDARAALAAAPMDGTAWALLGAAREALGDTSGAEQAMEQAVRLDPREVMPRLWLLAEAERRQDGPVFTQHLDALLRAHPEQVEVLAGRLAAFIGTPLGLQVRSALATAPPWRARLLQAWWLQQGRAFLFHAYLSSLAKGQRLRRDEAIAWSNALERDSQFAAMAWLWQQGNTEDGAPPKALLVDGGFRAPPANYGLGWRVFSPPGASVVVSPGSGPTPGTGALVLQFFGQRVPFDNVHQYLRLSAGRYELAYQVRADGLRNERGLQWMMRCPGTWQVLGESPPAKGRHGWREDAFTFTVPPQGCDTQLLSLRLQASGPSEQWLAGGLRYAGLTLRPD